MSKYTSAPWKVTGTFGSGWKIRQEFTNKPIADIHLERSKTDDAMLIAAAPEMYNSLLAALNSLVMIRDGYEHSAGTMDLIIDEAKMALAKAKGK